MWGRGRQDGAGAQHRIACLRTAGQMIDRTHLKRKRSETQAPTTTLEVGTPGPNEGSAASRAPARPDGAEGAEEAGSLFRDIVEGASDLIYRLDLEGRLTYANPATAKLTGYSAAELAGLAFTDLLRDDARDAFRDALATLAATGEPMAYVDLPLVTRDGTTVCVGQLTRVIVADGRPVGMQGEARDVTEQRRLGAALAASEARLRAMVECLGEGLIVTDADDRVLYVNPAFERITGYTSADLIGNRAFELLSDQGAAETDTPPGREGHRGELPERYEMRIRHGKGHRVDVRVIATPLHDGAGEPFAMLSSVSDVTDQKRHERAREEIEERFRQLTKTIRESFWIATADELVPLYVSPAYEEIMGEPRERMLSARRSVLDSVHPEDRAHVERVLAAERTDTRGFTVEFRAVRSDGEIRWLRNRGFAVRDAEGRVDRFAGVVEDVTEHREAREALRRGEASYRSLYNSLSELVYIQDLEGRFLNVNDAVLRAYGYTRDELIGSTPEMLADAERLDAEALKRMVARAAAGEPQRFEFWGRRKDGTIFPKEVVLTRTEYFGQEAVIAVGRDISERKRAEAESERLAALSRENPNPVLECDASGRPVHINPAARAAADELGLESIEGLLPANHPELVRQVLARGEGLQNVLAAREGRIFEWTYRPHRASGVVHLFASDVTARWRMEEQLRHEALHDSLTDLPNRMLFMERLEHAVQRARRREGSLFAVIFLDVDRFKIINDSLGHHIGDELLVALADRLRACLRLEDTVARFGGDEFAILVESIGDVSDATRVAERIQEAVSNPLQLEGLELAMSTSIGIALGASADDRPSDLLRNADVAMYRAKAGGAGRFEVFDRAMHTAALDRLQLEAELRQALQRDELVLHYQPVIEIATGRPWAVEALVRWNHPDRGVLLPTAFIPVAEETGAVRVMGAWALRTATRQLREWRERLGEAAPRSVAVNVSPRQFSQNELLQQVREALEESGIPPGALCLEIAEGGMMQSVEAAVAVLRRVKELGVRLCIDDFGTGYSSLSNLHRFPIDEVKIDGSFVQRMLGEPAALQLVRTMVTLTHSLGGRPVAEWVETPEQLEVLRELGTHSAQGYLFGRPMEAAAVEALFGSDAT